VKLQKSMKKYSELNISVVIKFFVYAHSDIMCW